MESISSPASVPPASFDGLTGQTLKFTDHVTTPFTSKCWITPENVLRPLTTFHYELFRDPAISQTYGVPFEEEVPTRLAALRVGFVRVNYERNGGLLTIETMRWNRVLRTLIDRLVLENCDAIDLARIHLLNKAGDAVQVGCASLMNLRMIGKPVSRITLGSWNNLKATVIL